MKLSLITPIYRESKDFARFLERLTLQTNNNFEAIFIVDTNNENVLGLLDEAKGKIKGQVKVIFNSKRNGRTEAVYSGLAAATGDYAIIFSVTNSFDHKMVETALKKLEDKKYPDILEFNARFKDPIKFDGLIRKSFKGETFNKEEAMAYTYPFDFNKVYKLELLRETEKLPSLSKRLNSRYTVELVFKSILLAKSYSTTSTKIVRSKKSVGVNFNPLKISREWDELLAQEQFIPYKSALTYNRYFATKIIYSSLAATTKNKVLIAKVNDLISINFEISTSDFFAMNQFILSVNKESDLLRKYKNQTSEKAFKALNG